jgi:hypothetical protein
MRETDIERKGKSERRRGEVERRKERKPSRTWQRVEHKYMTDERKTTTIQKRNLCDLLERLLINLCGRHCFLHIFQNHV